MDHQVQTSLERIENPILVILLVVLIAAVLALWYVNGTLQNRIHQNLAETIAALKDIGAALARINERLDDIENRLPLILKNVRRHEKDKNHA